MAVKFRSQVIPNQKQHLSEAQNEIGYLPGPGGGYVKWPSRVGIVAQPLRTGRLSTWKSIQVVHHDLLDMLASASLAFFTLY